ncbi:MAG: response regulator [Planctomycetaceae bacterium]|nr:response regulator [Planctomycetaceae bacterium]
MATRKYFWGISLKIALYLGVPLFVTLMMLSFVFVPVSQEVMFNHEMTDLADETTLRGAELEDLSQDLLKDFNLLARTLEQGDDVSFETMSYNLAPKYVLIEYLEYERSGEGDDLEIFRILDQGRTRDYTDNLSYQNFIQKLEEEVQTSPESEKVLTAFRKARLHVEPTEKTPHEIENHVFWVGGQISTPNEESPRGRWLVMALGFDEKLARLMASPRHMAILLDQHGHVILNPFEDGPVANSEGDLIQNIGELDAPFQQGQLYDDVASYAKSADWSSIDLEDMSLETLNRADVLEDGLSLKKNHKYFYWESPEIGFTPAEIEIAQRAMRRETTLMAREEWDAGGEDSIFMRAGGISNTVGTLRLLTTEQERIAQLQAEITQRLVEEFQTDSELSDAEKQSAIAKLKALQRQVPRPTACRTCRFSAIQIPMTVGPGSELSGFFMLRAVFEEEVRAALDAQLNQAEWMVAGMIFLTFATVFYSGRRIGKLLERMSASAETISTLTFDQTADVETWEQQADAVSSRLPTDRQDELGVLSRSFQRMLVDILNAQIELRKLNAELEERVRQRTLQLEEANQDLEVANEELKLGRDEAEQLSRSKDEFLASVSHELRNPLNWLHGSVQFLEMTSLDEQQKKDVQTVRRATEELGALIEDILDYQKIVMNGMPIEIHQVELEQLLIEVWDSLKLHAEKHGAELSFDWTRPAGLIETDARRFKQIVKNLAGNSCKFRDPDGNRPNQVRVEVQRKKEHLTIIISDTGRGMKPEEQDKLFVKFQKLSSQEGNKSGTGLGLVITKSLVELMGGTIEFESEFGVGTTFKVNLPLSYRDSQDRPSTTDATTSEITVSSGKSSRKTQPAGEKKKTSKVMVIDDDPKMQEMMSRYLTEHGYHVIVATDGIEALGLVKKEAPDLITLDVKLPELDGWAVLAALKTDVETADVPVIMTTTLDDREKGMSLGADEYLVKPVDWPHLERVISQFSTEQDSATVLVIEDDEQNRQLLRRQMETAGWYVEEAENGREGLDRLNEIEPQLILLDLMMPIMDGFEFLAERQKSAKFSAIPVIIVTAKELSPHEVQQLRGSVTRILQKGAYSQSELLEEIRLELDRRATHD